MLKDIKSMQFTRRIIYLLAQADTMSENLLTELFAIAGFKPDVESWRSYLSKAVLILGVLFTLSGVLFFFAYNWHYLHKFVKLAIVGSLVIIPAVISLVSDLRKLHAKLSLLAIAFFTGTFLAVFGQIYQTGANAYDLFLYWAILISGIVVISDFQPLWFMWLVLVNVTVLLFAGQILRHWLDPYVIITLFTIDSIGLVLYEFFSIKKNPWFSSRWLPRILGITVVAPVTIAAITGIFTDFKESGYILCLITAISGYLGIFYVYSRRIYDLSSVAVSCICVIALLFSVILKVSKFDESSMFIIGGLVIIGLTTTSSIVIMKINKSWKSRL